MTETLLRASLQSGVALLVIALLCRLFSKLSPNTRCWLWRLGYLKCLAAFAIPLTLAIPLLPTVPPVQEAMPALTTPLPAVSDSLPPVSSTLPAIAPTLPAKMPTLPASIAHVPAPVITLPTLSSVVVLYLLGAGVALLRLVAAAAQTLQLLQRATPVSLPALPALCARFGLRQAPRTARLSGFSSPLLAFGTILLPEPALPDEALIVAHELAHVKRRDLLWETLGALVGVLLWFHPLVWWARREEKLAREQAADALALTVTAAPRAEYARVLLTATLAQTPELAVGAFASPSRLRRRLEALAQPALPRRKAVALLGLACVLALPALVPWRAVARQGTVVVAPQLTAMPGQASSTGPRISMRIRGRVVDSNGKALVGALVTDTKSKRHWTADKAGRFEGEGDATYGQLEASAPGYQTSKAASVSSSSGWQLVLKRVGTWEAAFQDSNGKPLRNLAVCLISGLHPGRTDAQGRYVIRGMGVLGSRDYSLNSPRYKPMDAQWAIASVEGSVANNVFLQRFVLIPARSLSGTVRDAKGNPLSDVPISLVQTNSAVSDHVQGRYTTSTDSTGKFQLTQLRPGKYRVRASTYLKPFAEVETQELSLETKSLSGLALTLTPGVTVRGVVREAKSAAPLAKAQVRYAEPYTYLMRSNGKLIERPGKRYYTRETDAQGRFELHLMPGIPYDLQVTGTRQGPVSTRHLETTQKTIQGKEGDTHELSFTLERPRPQVGRVVDSTGRPVAGATLELRPTGRRPWFSQTKPALKSDAQGNFSIPEAQLGFGIEEGDRSENGKTVHYRDLVSSVKLIASKDDLRGEVTINATSESPTEVVLRAGQWVTVHGRILGPDGKEPPGITISATLWQENNEITRPKLTRGANGDFILRTEPGKTLYLSARSSDKSLGFFSTALPLALPLGTTKDLGVVTLPRLAGFMAGRIRDAAGKTLKNARLTVQGQHCTAETQLDGQGRFRLTGFAPGDTLHTIVAVVSQGKTLIWELTLPVNQNDIDVRLPKKPTHVMNFVFPPMNK